MGYIPGCVYAFFKSRVSIKKQKKIPSLIHINEFKKLAGLAGEELLGFQEEILVFCLL